MIPPEARGAGFGLLSTGSLVGLALSPIICGLLGTLSLRAVFVLDTVASCCSRRPRAAADGHGAADADDAARQPRRCDVRLAPMIRVQIAADSPDRTRRSAHAARRSARAAESSRIRPTRSTGWPSIPADDAAVARLYEVKGREAATAIPLIAARVEQASGG